MPPPWWTTLSSWEGLGCVLAGFHAEGQAAALRAPWLRHCLLCPLRGPFQGGSSCCQLQLCVSSSLICECGGGNKCVPCRGLSRGVNASAFVKHAVCACVHAESSSARPCGLWLPMPMLTANASVSPGAHQRARYLLLFSLDTINIVSARVSIWAFVTGITSSVASGPGSGRVLGGPQPEQLCKDRGQCLRERAGHRGGSVGGVPASLVVVWALVCQPCRAGSLPQMPGLSSLSADGASDSEGCHGGQGPGSRFPRPLLLGCLPLADVLPGSLCSCPELPEGPPGSPGTGSSHRLCLQGANPRVFSLVLLQTPGPGGGGHTFVSSLPPCLAGRVHC